MRPKDCEVRPNRGWDRQVEASEGVPTHQDGAVDEEVADAEQQALLRIVLQEGPEQEGEQRRDEVLRFSAAILRTMSLANHQQSATTKQACSGKRSEIY